jgi:enterochelin esterase-like enzyme
MQKATRKILASELQALLRALVDREGQVPAARKLGVSPQTVATLLAGLPVHAAIVEMVARRLVPTNQSNAATDGDAHRTGPQT